VDDDPLCLRIVEKMLKRCQYEGAGEIFFPFSRDPRPTLSLQNEIGRETGVERRRGERSFRLERVREDACRGETNVDEIPRAISSVSRARARSTPRTNGALVATP
jgi:hypothetical protein